MVSIENKLHAMHIMIIIFVLLASIDEFQVILTSYLFHFVIIYYWWSWFPDYGIRVITLLGRISFTVKAFAIAWKLVEKAINQ